MVIVAKTSDCQCQCQFAIELLLNCDSMSLVFYVNLLMCNVLLLWRTLQKAYFLQFLNCKKLKFWNCKKLNLWNVFTSNFFTVSELQKNCLWERRFHISWFYCHCHCLKKLISSVLKQKKKNWLEVRKKCCVSHVLKSPFFAVLILPKNAVSKRQLCLRFETPDYNHKRTLLYA